VGEGECTSASASVSCEHKGICRHRYSQGVRDDVYVYSTSQE
jgi:hypothetical protein